MESPFVKERLVDPYITQMPSMAQIIHPYQRISTVVQVLTQMLGGDSFSHTKHWIFGYKLHIITSSTGSLIQYLYQQILHRLMSR